MNSFKFNGISSEEFGLFIQTPPTYQYPKRDLSVTHVPGRNGDVVIDNKCYANVERSYLVGKGYYPNTNYYTNFQSVLNWLNSAKGKYVRLEDSYDSEVYRLASFQMSGSFIDYFDQMGAATITFNCKPQRYLLSGEKQTTYAYDSEGIEIINPSEYEALPEIEINNISTIDGVNNYVIMLTVKDSANNAVSSITITNYGTSENKRTLIINSEEQIVTDDIGNDVYENIGLNGKPFPVFKGDASKILLNKFSPEGTNVIPSYNSVIIESQSRCESRYKTYAAMVKDAQDSFFIKSWTNLVSSKRKFFSANAVQAYLATKGDSYTFESFNDILNYGGTADSCSFTGTRESIPSVELRPWISSLVQDTQDANKFNAIAAEDGFYRVDDTKDDRIRFVRSGNMINLKPFDPDEINTILYYKAKIVEGRLAEGHILNIENQNAHYELAAEYEDIPEWLSCVIEYESATGSPGKVSYKIASAGYYWTDKSPGLVGTLTTKAEWNYHSSNDIGNTLAETTWDSSKKAFVAPGPVFGKSTNTTFTYRYINATPSTLPQYEDVVDITVDDRGVETRTVRQVVTFEIFDIGTKLENINIKTKSDGSYVGYFKFIKSSSTGNWIYLTAGSDIGSVKGTESFEIDYLNDVPTYADEEGFPDWLDPSPNKYNSSGVLITSGADMLKASYILFKTKVGVEEAYYAVSKTAEDEIILSDLWNEQHFTDPTTQHVIEFIYKENSSFVHAKKSVDDSYYIYRVTEIPTVYQYNREVKYVGSATTPWIALIPSSEVIDNIPVSFEYRALLPGLYRWDNNSVWKYISQADISGNNNLLFESGGQADNDIYYLESVPQYSTYPLSTLFDIIPVLDPTTIVIVGNVQYGNPIAVNYVVKVAGYYRYNNVMDWKLYSVGDIICQSKITEENTIQHLNPVNNESESLSDITIKVKPRWWML